MTDDTTVADILGPWVDPHFSSGLVESCKEAWDKPIRSLSNQQLARLLQQRIAVEHVLPVARKRLEEKVDDETELYEGELKSAVDEASGHA